jgi:hypothetical protein
MKKLMNDVINLNENEHNNYIHQNYYCGIYANFFLKRTDFLSICIDFFYHGSRALSSPAISLIMTT